MYKHGFLESFSAKCGIGSSKLLAVSMLAAFLVGVSYIFLAAAAPNAPANITFEQNNTQNYDRDGTFTINWSAVTNEDISNYTVYIYNNTGGALIAESNTSVTGYYFVGINGANYTFNISAVNTTGDAGPNSTSTWMFVDTVAPAINVQSPLNGTNYTTMTIKFNITGSETLSWAGYSLDGAANISMANETGDWNAQNTSMAQGSHTVVFWVNDSAGNINSTSRTFSVDSIAPVVTINTPANNAFVNYMPYINGTATDAGTGLASIKTNSSNYSGVDETSPFNFSAAGLIDGTYTVNVSANDTAGNVGWANVTFTYDTIPPFVQIALPAGGANYSSASRTLNYTATDSNLNTVWYQYNGTNTTLTGNDTFTALNNQQSTLVLYANDSAGNVNATSITFTVDTAAPIITAYINPPNGSIVSNKQTLTFNISVTDGAGVGAAACKINVGNVSNFTGTIVNNWCNVTGVSLADLALGVQNINIWINDSVGNVNYTTLYAVRIGGVVIPGVTQWNTSNPAPSLNLSAGDMFFYDGNNVSIIANFTTMGSDSITYPYDNLTVSANATSIGVGSPTVTALGGGLYRITAAVNYSNISAGVSQFVGAPINLLVSNDSSGIPVNLGPPLMAVAVLVNMSTIPSCPPPDQPLPPVMPWNGSLMNVTSCVPADVSPCSTVDAPVYQINSTHVNLCGPTFGAGTTNFSEIADTGDFSAVPLVINVPGKAKINFSANVDMSDQNKASAIMQFAMKNLMSRGQFGINESEWNGEAGKPNLNVSATLTMYNISNLISGSHYSISYGNFNGMEAPTGASLCPPSRCSGIVLINGNLTFTVSSFSSYVIGPVNYTLVFANISGPISKAANQSVNATYYINISNAGNNTDTITYNLSLQGIGLLNLSQVSLNSTAMGGTTWVIAELNVSNATAGTYYTNVTAVLSDDASITFNSRNDGLGAQIVTTVNDITNPQVYNTTSASGNPGAVVQISNVNVTDNVNIAQVFVNLSSMGSNTLVSMTLVSGNNVSGNYSANITVPIYTLNGTYALPIRANDTSGNVNATQTVTLTVNNVAPAVTVLYPAGGYIRGTSTTVNATATDNNGNNTIANVTFYYYNGTYTFIGAQNVSQGNAVYNVTWNTTGLNLANISIFVNATDGINWANGAGSNFTVDTDTPLLTLVLPSNTTYTSVSRTLNFTATDATSGVNTIWYQYNGTNTTTAGNTTFTAISNDQSTLILYANDSAGNINSTSVTFTVDTTTPAITVRSPSNQTYTTASIWFNITGNKALNWSGYSLDGAANATMTNSSGNWNNLSTVSQGQHNVMFYANDSLGNLNQSAMIYFAVDSIAPSFSAIAVTGASVYAGDFNFSVTINEQNFQSANYTITNATNASIVWTSNTTGITSNGTFASIAFDGIYLPAGNWTINVASRDIAGNTNTTSANITSYAAIQAPSAYDSRVQAPGTIGSGTPGIYNFTVYTKGYPYIRMYLNLTSGSDKFATANNIANAKLYNGTDSVAIDDEGSYDGASTLIIGGISASALPGYATGSITTGLYKQPVQLYLYPYSGLSAGTYSGNFGFGVSSTY